MVNLVFQKNQAEIADWQLALPAGSIAVLQSFYMILIQTMEEDNVIYPV
jgi:hypothetical protein